MGSVRDALRKGVRTFDNLFFLPGRLQFFCIFFLYRAKKIFVKLTRVKIVCRWWGMRESRFSRMKSGQVRETHERVCRNNVAGFSSILSNVTRSMRDADTKGFALLANCPSSQNAKRMFGKLTRTKIVDVLRSETRLYLLQWVERYKFMNNFSSATINHITLPDFTLWILDFVKNTPRTL